MTNFSGISYLLHKYRIFIGLYWEPSMYIKFILYFDYFRFATILIIAIVTKGLLLLTAKKWKDSLEVLMMGTELMEVSVFQISLMKDNMKENKSIGYKLDGQTSKAKKTQFYFIFWSFLQNVYIRLHIYLIWKAKKILDSIFVLSFLCQHWHCLAT